MNEHAYYYYLTDNAYDFFDTSYKVSHFCDNVLN